MWLVHIRVSSEVNPPESKRIQLSRSFLFSRTNSRVLSCVFVNSMEINLRFQIFFYPQNTIDMGKIRIDVRLNKFTAQGPGHFVPLMKIRELCRTYRCKVGKDLLPGKSFGRPLLLRVIITSGSENASFGNGMLFIKPAIYNR